MKDYLCPFCVPNDDKAMKSGDISTEELEDARHLTCADCGFSMTAKSDNHLKLAHRALWESLEYPEYET